MPKLNIATKILRLAASAPSNNESKPRRGRPSKFSEHKPAILLMRKRRFSWTRIAEVLNEAGLECTYQGLLRWSNLNMKKASKKG